MFCEVRRELLFDTNDLPSQRIQREIQDFVFIDFLFGATFGGRRYDVRKIVGFFAKFDQMQSFFFGNFLVSFLPKMLVIKKRSDGNISKYSKFPRNIPKMRKFLKLGIFSKLEKFSKLEILPDCKTFQNWVYFQNWKFSKILNISKMGNFSKLWILPKWEIFQNWEYSQNGKFI